MNSELEHIKTGLRVCSFRKPSDRSDNNSLGMGHWSCSSPVLPLLVAARLLIFALFVNIWITGLRGGGDEG